MIPNELTTFKLTGSTGFFQKTEENYYPKIKPRRKYDEVYFNCKLLVHIYNMNYLASQVLTKYINDLFINSLIRGASLKNLSPAGLDKVSRKLFRTSFSEEPPITT